MYVPFPDSSQFFNACLANVTSDVQWIMEAGCLSLGAFVRCPTCILVVENTSDMISCSLSKSHLKSASCKCFAFDARRLNVWEWQSITAWKNSHISQNCNTSLNLYCNRTKLSIPVEQIVFDCNFALLGIEEAISSISTFDKKRCMHLLSMKNSELHRVTLVSLFVNVSVCGNVQLEWGTKLVYYDSCLSNHVAIPGDAGYNSKIEAMAWQILQYRYSWTFLSLCS